MSDLEINQIKNLGELSEELCTMKIMLASLYKSITNDKRKDGIIKWEKECNRIAKQFIADMEKEAKEAENGI